MQDRLILQTEAGRERDAALDTPVNLPDAVRQRLDACEPLVELACLLAGSVAAKRQEVAVALLIVAAVTREALPSRSRPARDRRSRRCRTLSAVGTGRGRGSDSPTALISPVKPCRSRSCTARLMPRPSPKAGKRMAIGPALPEAAAAS